MSETTSEKRFGLLAVKKGYITAEQVMNARAIQVKEKNELRKSRPIGTILQEQGLMTLMQIDEVLQELGKKT